MRLFQSVEQLSSLAGPIHLAIGVFDGIHLGHQAVIKRAITAAADRGGTAVVLLFTRTRFECCARRKHRGFSPRFNIRLC
jgi:FAD synthase